MSDTVNGSSCSYTTLNNYNSSTAGSLGSPAYSASTVKGYYVVPNYSAPGYNALTHGNDTPTCSGYFNVTSAYGANAANCNTQYSQMPCGNSIIKGERINDYYEEYDAERCTHDSNLRYPYYCMNENCKKFHGKCYEKCTGNTNLKWKNKKNGKVVCE